MTSDYVHSVAEITTPLTCIWQNYTNRASNQHRRSSAGSSGRRLHWYPGGHRREGPGPALWSAWYPECVTELPFIHLHGCHSADPVSEWVGSFVASAMRGPTALRHRIPRSSQHHWSTYTQCITKHNYMYTSICSSPWLAVLSCCQASPSTCSCTAQC